MAAMPAAKRLDCCGMQCPGPIMAVGQALEEMDSGQVLEICSTDPAFGRDISAWCGRMGHKVLGHTKENKRSIYSIQKDGRGSCPVPEAGGPANLPQGKTMVVFSQDMDRALASFIIANGAASMGRKVTMFFTFWGLNILRKPQPQAAGKTFLEKMFGWMMPKGAGRLPLSRMHMAGMGPALIKKIMRDKNVQSLESLIQAALDNGVQLVACSMSMDIMGIKEEELIPGVQLGGVAAYLADAEEANVNLFI